MEILAPSAWEGASVVTVVIVLALLHGLALVRGWIVWGPAHREIVAGKDTTIAQDNEREKLHLGIMADQAKTISEQKVASMMSEHLLSSIRDLARGDREAT